MRDERIDLLRAIGLLAIILAHVDPSEFLFDLRNFDVPLMVIVGGMSFYLSYRKSSYFNYIQDRFVRLVLPVWMFLTFLFLIALLVNKPISQETVVDSYLLIGGIGYVWIIRVFLLVAIFAPLVKIIDDKIFDKKYFYVILLAFYVVYELLVKYLVPASGSLAEIAVGTIPYVLVFALGIHVYQWSARASLICGAIFLAAYFWLAWVYSAREGYYVSTQVFKYPPTAYYLSYAVGVSMVLWAFSAKITGFFKKIKVYSFLMFCGSNSIWIYLWHILFVSMVKQPYYYKYFIVVACSCFVVYLQSKVVRGYLLGKINSPKGVKFVKSVLTG